VQTAAIQDDRELARWTVQLDSFDPPAGAAVAAWLQESGLLTERLRACCRGETGLVVVAQGEAPISPADAAVLRSAGNLAFVREVELTCDGHPWVFAQTLIPPATLARHGWLSTLGTSALGERLAAVPGIERGPLEFACLTAASALHRRALRTRVGAAPRLWARRSWFAIGGDRLLVQEVFLPEALQ
jgi:chorismate--pyruvate lyase